MKTEIESEQTKIQLEIPESYELSENEDGDRTYACFERPGSSDMVFSFLLEADEEHTYQAFQVPSYLHQVYRNLSFLNIHLH